MQGTTELAPITEVEDSGPKERLRCPSCDFTHYVMHFARLARHYAFHASRGSDFHGPEESYFDLGKLPQLPEDLKPVWRLVI